MSQKVLDILLQKNDKRIPWGFSLCAGPDGAILIDKVFPGTLASQYLNPGDRLLSIDDKDCTRMSTMEASQIASRPANALNMLVAKNADKVVHRQFSSGPDFTPSSVTNVRVTPDASVRSTPVTNVRFTPDPNLRSTPVASVWSKDDDKVMSTINANVQKTTNSNLRSTTDANVRTNTHVRFTPDPNLRSTPVASVWSKDDDKVISTTDANVRSAGNSTQEAWRRRCRQSTSPSSSARRAKAAFWERCTSPQRQRLPPPDHLPPSSRSASSGRSTPTRSFLDVDAASEPDVDRRRLSADWSDSGRGSYVRQQSCPSWITNSNESLNTLQQSHNSRKLDSTEYLETSSRESRRSRTVDSRFSRLNSHGNDNSRCAPSQETKSGIDDNRFSSREKENNSNWFHGAFSNYDSRSVADEKQSNTFEKEESELTSSQKTRCEVDDSRFNSRENQDCKWRQETNSVVDDHLSNSHDKDTRCASNHSKLETAENQFGSNVNENNEKLFHSQETSFSHVDSSESKTQKEEEDLKWFSSNEIKYGFVDSEARTHFVEDSQWPGLDQKFKFADGESKLLHGKQQNVEKHWSEEVQRNSTSKSSFHNDLKQFSSLPKNFERQIFDNLLDSTEVKKETDKKVTLEKSSVEDYSSQMSRKEKREETQQSYHVESSSQRLISKKCLESEFEKSFEQFAKMMHTGEESSLFKKAEEIVMEDESRTFSDQMSENFKETERRFESYVKDLNATDNANVEKKFERTVMEKNEQISVTRSHTPAGFYDNHQEASSVEEKVEKKIMEEEKKTANNSSAEVMSKDVEKKPRPVSEFLDRQGLYDAFNRLRSSSPSDVNETLFRICDVLQTDARSTTGTGRQQNQISGGGNSPSATAYHDSTVPAPPPPPPMMNQGGAPPPPPPPPPLGLVHIPNMRLKTEIPDVRREPPAAIQNAMMTKDKKPFTYTPGGLDLSEIRSPRMARRINRNAHADDGAVAASNGVEPRPVGQPRPLSMPPQMAVPVFPPQAPPQPPPPPPPAPTQQHWTPQPPSPPQPMAVPKLQPVQQRQAPSPVQQQQNTGSIYVPPVQSQPPPQPRSQLGSLYVPPVANNTVNRGSPIQQESPSPQLNKSPAPWMTRNSPQQQQQAKELPPWVAVNRDTPSSPVTPPSPSQPPPPAYNSANNYGAQTRIIPIQIEGRETPQSNTRIIPIQMEGSPSPQHNPHAPQFNYQQQQQQQYQQQQQQHHQLQQRRPVYVHNKNNPQYANAANENSVVDGRSPQGWSGQQPDDSAPVQSRSFRVLQKVTDSFSPAEDLPYNSQGVPLSQLRKLQLSDDDRALMNKVKTQDSIIAPVDEENPRYRGGYIPSRVFKALDESVDDEQFLHNESDPRYRGASIPSRAFRMLQNMTDHPAEYMTQVPQGSGSPSVLSNRRPQPQEPTPVQPPQPYIPPSEQQVQEPRKYQGGAIPSRSFRMLQAMTAGSNPSGSETHENWPEQINNVEGEHASYSYPNPYYEDPNNYYNNGYYYDMNQPPQTAEEQQQFWEHYNAMCAYMAEMNAAAYRYSPFPHAYPPPPVTPVPPPPHPLSTHYFSDSDGYSSTDEMAYYGAYFQRRPPPAPLPNYRMFRGRSATPTPAPRIVITPTESTSSDVVAECKKAETNTNTTATVTNSSELENSSSGSDTEVDDDNNDEARSTGLKTIRSVPDISIYKDSTGSDISSSIPRSDSGSVKEEDDEDDDDEKDDEEVEGEVQDEEHYDDDSSLHQLSVIYEESENSSLSSKVGRRDSVVSEEDVSSATLDNCDDTDSGGDDDDDDDGITDSDTVTVRLPLKLKFSKAGDDRDMATVIVGKSEVQPTNEGVQRQSPEKKALDTLLTDNEEEEKLVDGITEPKCKIDEQSQDINVEEEEQQQEHQQDVTSEEEESEGIAIEKEPEGMIVEEITRDDFEADVSVTISLKKLKPKPETSVIIEKSVPESFKDSSVRGNSPVDFWKTLNSEDESVSGNEVTARGSISSATEEDEARPEESDSHWEDDSSSTSVLTVRTSDATFKPGISGSDIDDSDDNLNQPCTKEPTSSAVLNEKDEVEEEEAESDHENSADEEEDESSESSDSSTDSDSDSVEGDEEDEVEERVVYKKDSHIMKQFEKSCDKMHHLKVEKHSNNKIGTAMRKDEVQNDESEEEEEDDSGVTSDMSRHISETDTDPECSVSTRKMNSYQRAATHSRLFKLLQEECAQEDEEGNEVPKAPDEIPMSRKDKLTLSLNEQSQNRERDSLSSSSGVDSPSSPNNFDQLANELVQSLLKRKKGRHFRKLPLAKLHDAAVRILKEDAGRCEAVSSPSDESNIYSPVDRVHIPSNRNSGSFSDAYYGDNYHDYCNYYSTWGYPNYGPDSINDSLGSDIVPSKTFKMLREHTTAGQVNSHLIEGLSAKCPRILSSKNVPADLQSPSPLLSPTPTPSTET